MTVGPCPSHLASHRTELVYPYLATVEETDVDAVREALHVDLLDRSPAAKVLAARDPVERDGTPVRLARDDG